MASNLIQKSLSSRKGWLTKAINSCKQFISDEQFDGENLENGLINLKERWSSYLMYSNKLEDTLTEEGEGDKLEKLLIDRETLEIDYLTNVELCERKLKMFKRTHSSQDIHTPVKLPVQTLPVFDGDGAWQSFWESFSALIDKRSDLDDISKLMYLQGQLKGEAAELIVGYPLVADSYKHVINLLRDNYGDGNIIIKGYVYKLLDLPSPNHNYKELQSFRITLDSIIKTLSNFKNIDQASWIIDLIVRKKLHYRTIDALYNQLGKSFFSYAEVSKSLLCICNHMQSTKELCTTVSMKPTKGKFVKATQGNNFYKSNEVGTYTTSVSKEPNINMNSHNKYSPIKGSNENVNRKLQNPPQCILCKQPHVTSMCDKYSTVSSRKTRAKHLGKCELCMGSHELKNCTFSFKTCPKCKDGYHHSVFCPKFDNDKDNRTDNFENIAVSLSVDNSFYKEQNTSVVPTGKVILQNANHMVSTIALFDSGSQRTFISKGLVQQLELPVVGQSYLTISGFLTKADPQRYDVVNCEVKLGNFIKTISAVVIHDMQTSITMKGLTKLSQHLKDCGVQLIDNNISNDVVGPIGLIIGSDYFGHFINGVVQRDNTFLLSTPDGYMIFGQIKSYKFPNMVEKQNEIMSDGIAQPIFVARIASQIDPLLNQEILEEFCEPVHKLWDLDSIGINPCQDSPDDTKTYSNYCDTTFYKNGQYWVRLPWKSEYHNLPSNYRLAYGQLKTLLTQLSKNSEHLKFYNSIICDQLNNNYIEEVIDANSQDKNCHYLPHHAVKKNSPTTSLRIVFNCSSKLTSKELSLNDCLMTGPSLTERLGNVLLNFRTQNYAYTADISKAFLRVGLQTCDRDYTRFLWPTNPFDLNSSIKTYRFKSVLFGSTASPFLLQATLNQHLSRSDQPLSAIITKQFYVDNLQGTVSNERELLELYETSNTLLNKANMPLQCWNINSSLLRNVIKRDYPRDEIPSFQNILGLNWNIENDTLSLKFSSFCNFNVLTKRILLSEVSRLFDPLGFFNPITVKGKLLIQSAWQEKLNWDTPLPVPYTQQWEQLKQEFSEIPKITISRRFDSESSASTMHIFCDASLKAYGAVAYLCSNANSNLIMSKVKVAPLKTRTLPQLELTAVEVGVKLASYIVATCKHVEIARVCIWTDSSIVLQWIRNNSSKIVYVKNRISTILELSSSFEFYYVPTESNPADLLTRGISLSKFVRSLWFHGPLWLLYPDEWPKQMDLTVNEITVESEVTPLQPTPMDGSKYSSLDKLLNITNFVFKFLTLKGLRLNTKDPLCYWIKLVQLQHYNKEFKILKFKTTDRSRLINDLGLFIDEIGIIRCRGRLHNSDLTYNTKHPILLPKQHWFTNLIVHKAHKTVMHGGLADTLNEIRQSYWVPQGRQAVKNYLKGCIVCKRYDSRTLTYPGPPSLPKDRVSNMVPFEVTGVDYTGSIIITGNADKIPVKAYVCVFTCANTRAVHLEVAENMTADIFIRIFRNFAARRSCPWKLISDQGSNLVSGSEFLQTIFNNPKVLSMLHTRRCVWKFSPARAPWQNGFTERMVGIVKRCLRKTLHKSKISYEEFRTVVTEIENRINNRPLTYMSNGVNEIEALTPAHLLYGRRLNPIPIIKHDELDDPTYDDKPQYLRERYNYLNKILRTWQSVWRNEYLTALRERFYGACQPKIHNYIKAGDVAIVRMEGPRNYWPLGKVIAVHPDGEGVVRVATVLIKGRQHLLTIDKLIPLEINDSSLNVPPQLDVPESEARSVRRAAVRSSELTRVLLRNE